MTHDSAGRLRLRDPAALVAARRRAGLSQRQLAAAAGCSHGTLGDLETGRRRNGLSIPTAHAIAKALGVTDSTLFAAYDGWMHLRNPAMLTSLRTAKWLSQAQLARLVGRKVDTIYDLEHGRRRAIPTAVADAIAANLDVDVDRLFVAAMSSLSEHNRLRGEQSGRVA